MHLTDSRERNEKCQGLRSDARVPMTPMIDVVFLILIFFVITSKPTDVLSEFGVSRSRDKHPPTGTLLPTILITIERDSYMIGNRPVTLGELEGVLKRQAGYTAEQGVLITCAGDASHSRLIKLLDMCRKAGIANISIRS